MAAVQWIKTTGYIYLYGSLIGLPSFRLDMCVSSVDACG